jgi:hypothetical protein
MKDEKPGYFVALHKVALGERQRFITVPVNSKNYCSQACRLAQYLFKIDSYYSLIRGQPRFTALEELHFPPPCSYATWNSDGLDIWESRVTSEPPLREAISMAEMYNKALSNPGPGNPLVFVEDIQMCMCVIQPTIRRLHKEPVDSIAGAILNGLKMQLDGMKYKLDQMASQQPSLVSFGEEQYLPYRYYYGYEDQNKDGWQRPAVVRVKTLIFDALSLYHVLGMHLYSDVFKIRQLAKDLESHDMALSETHRKAQDSRKDFVSNWANSYNSKAAIFHADQILNLHKSLALDPDFEKRGLDSITYGGLRTAMLIVWAFCMFGRNLCQACDTSGNRVPSTDYIDIDGLQVCVCNTNNLVDKFRSFTPERWSLPETGI